MYLFVSASGLDLCLHRPPTGQTPGSLFYISSSCTRFWSFETGPHAAQAGLRFPMLLRMTLKSYLRASTSSVLGSQATLFGLLFNHPSQDAQREPRDNLLDSPCLPPLFATPIGPPFPECHHFKLFYKWIPQPGICWDWLFVSADLPGDSPKMLCEFSRLDVCRQSKQDGLGAGAVRWGSEGGMLGLEAPSPTVL